MVHVLINDSDLTWANCYHIYKTSHFQFFIINLETNTFCNWELVTVAMAELTELPSTSLG
jgi:hypothetical protein